MLEEELFNGKYRILKILGSGGMGTVYLAENIKLGNLWAIKEIRKKPDSSQITAVEPGILKKLNHPALPRIFDIMEDEESIYIVVDYIEGVPLDQELKRQGKFPESTVLEWAKQLCDVLHYLHSFSPNPIIYRDMKPSNMILTRAGAIKLIDFGIAREYKEGAGSDTIHIGTRGYAAPEQYGAGQTNVTTDIYSLGVTLYHLLTGKRPDEPPYEIKPARYFNPGLSEEIEEIILKCTRQDPDQRYQTARQLLADINHMGKPDLTGFIGEHRPGTASMKRAIWTVLDNCEFACELAYAAAKSTGVKVILMELNTLYSTACSYLNIRSGTDGMVYLKQESLPLYEILQKKKGPAPDLAEYSVRRRELKNLHVLITPYQEAYDSEADEKIDRLIELAYCNYDITIILINKSVLDGFTIRPLLRSDYNIIAIRASLDVIRKHKAFVYYVNEKFGIPVEKTRCVAFAYKKGVNLSEGILKKIFPGSLYAGSIGYRSERERYRNMKACYIRWGLRLHRDEYAGVLAGLDIFPGKSLIDRLNSGFTGMIRSLAGAAKKVKFRLHIHTRCMHEKT